MTSSSHDVVKVFFFTCPTDPIWVWVQRIPSIFLYYCKQKFYNHFCKAWGFMLQNQGNMPWCDWRFKLHMLHRTSTLTGSYIEKDDFNLCLLALFRWLLPSQLFIIPKFSADNTTTSWNWKKFRERQWYQFIASVKEYINHNHTHTTSNCENLGTSQDKS